MGNEYMEEFARRNKESAKRHRRKSLRQAVLGVGFLLLTVGFPIVFDSLRVSYILYALLAGYFAFRFIYIDVYMRGKEKREEPGYHHTFLPVQLHYDDLAKIVQTILAFYPEVQGDGKSASRLQITSNDTRQGTVSGGCQRVFARKVLH